MTTKTVAAEILDAVGGRDNVVALTHCATRLRFNLADDAAVDGDRVKAIDGVLGVTNKGGQYQLIIGPSVATLYPEVMALAAVDEARAEGRDAAEPLPDPGASPSAGAPSRPRGPVARAVNAVFDTVSGIFVTFIPVLVAAGMISALLSLLTTFNLVSADSPTYVVLSAVQAAVFFFLPIFTGYAAGMKLGVNPFVGMGLGAFLCYSTINQATGLSVFGMSVATVTYSSTVFPVILGVLLMSFVEKGLKRVIPDVLKGVVVPAVTLLVGALATLLVLGPIGSVLGEYLATFITFISGSLGWLAPAIVAGVFPLLIFTGMHYGLLPVAMAAFASVGYDPLLMVAGFLSNMSEAAAAAGTGVLERDKRRRADSMAMSFSALCGITEPTLFGITLRNRRTLTAVMIGGLCGALFAGIASVKAFGFVGGLPSLPLFIDPAGGLTNLMYTIVAALISFGVTFTLTIVLNRKAARV
ncbi:MAG: PTS transporter subunit EIIC [Cellulomonadaceae bacterium]|nr:PTS transporter subunit EIIC [Cellulomonadaceae bacterium]